MLDLLFTLTDNLLTYCHNEDWGKSNPIGEDQELEEAWANSEHEVVFGDKTSWTIGLGNTTNSFGPRIDFNVDYSYFIKNIEKLGIGTTAGALITGTTGYFSLTFGPITSISYGATDLSLQRKKHADQEFEIIQEGKSSTPRIILITNILCTGIMATAVILTRINHFRGFLGSKNLKTVNAVNKGLNDAVKLVQPRYLALLTKMELAFHATAYLKEKLEEIKEIPNYINSELQETILEIKNRSTAVLNKLETVAEIKKVLNRAKADILAEVNKASEKVGNQITFIGSILDLFQETRDNWYETNQDYALLCKGISLEARGGWDSNPFSKGIPGKISLKSISKEWDQDGNPGKTLFETNLDVKSNSINMKIVKDGKKNVSSIDATEDSINLESKGVYIKLPDDDGNICTLHMNNNNIDIQCGKAAAGPSLKMDGKNSRASLSVSTDTLGKAIDVTEKFIKIAHVGDAQQVLKLPLIAVYDNKVVISAGISSITLNATGIELKSGASKLSLDPTTVSAFSTIIEQQSQLNNKINAILRTLKTNGIQIDKAGVTNKQ